MERYYSFALWFVRYRATVFLFGVLVVTVVGFWRAVMINTFHSSSSSSDNDVIQGHTSFAGVDQQRQEVEEWRVRDRLARAEDNRLNPLININTSNYYKKKHSPPRIYALNCPNFCRASSTTASNLSESSVFLLNYVITSPGRFRERARIRSTWGQSATYYGLTVRTIFVLSSMPKETNSNNTMLDDAVKFESHQYGDMIEEDSLQQTSSSPKNTGKMRKAKKIIVESLPKNHATLDLLALEWISQFCSQTKYVLKTEDDIFINIYTVVHHLKELAAENYDKKLLMCNVLEKNLTVHASRNLTEKSSLIKSEKKLQLKFCAKFLHIISSDVALAFLLASYSAEELSEETDNYYITGLLPQLLGTHLISHSSMTAAYCTDQEMSAYVHETEWYKYAFTQVPVNSFSNFMRIWKGLTALATNRTIPAYSYDVIIPGMFASEYLPRGRVRAIRV